MLSEFAVSRAIPVLVVLLISSTCDKSVDAAITYNGAKCGTKICSVGQFCSKFSTQCEDCALICSETTHNFDRELCTRECQDYLHDQRYARSRNNEAELARLQSQLNLILVLLVVVLLLLAVRSTLQLVKWCKGRGFFSGFLRKLKLKKKPEKMAPEDLTHANPHTQSPKVQLRNVPAARPQCQINRESTVFSIDGASTIQTVSTPISTRYPAEDSTLSYSYDNAALAITPTIPDRPKTGSSTGF